MNKVYMLLSCVVLAGVAPASVEISDLKVSPIEPIGVAIDYTVSGAMESDASRPLEVLLSLEGTNYLARSLRGATSCVDGKHRVYWDMAKDGLSFGLTNASVKVRYKFLTFCVIDLSSGPEAESYPVTYFDSLPKDDTYKTTKLLLRRIDFGTKPFYIGKYEVTQKQWDLVMGERDWSGFETGNGDSYPAYYVSYNRIRGKEEGAKWPETNSVDSTSFMGRLRERTKLDFDLPTSAQWEYACRAGTTTGWYFEAFKNYDEVAYRYMWSSETSKSSAHKVGTTDFPNQWGLYDMYGNVSELCLDLYDGSSSMWGAYRVVRGGGWNDSKDICNSYLQRKADAMDFSKSMGFRVSRTLP